MVKQGHSWETKGNAPGAKVERSVDPAIKAAVAEVVVGWETIDKPNNLLQPTGHFEWNLERPQAFGSPFFNTVVSHGILDALRGTLVGNIISYLACILASAFGSVEKIFVTLKEICRDTRIFVEKFQL